MISLTEETEDDQEKIEKSRRSTFQSSTETSVQNSIARISLTFSTIYRSAQNATTKYYERL